MVTASGVGHILRRPMPLTDCLNAPQRGHSSASREVSTHTYKGVLMLHYAVVFFIIALVAAFFGFGGIAVGAAGIAKVLFVVFLIGAIVSFLMSMGRRV